MTKKEKLYSRLFDAHIDYLEETYGKDASINIGWSQSEDCVTSKVYNVPREFVSSWYDEGGHVQHEITKAD